jgi:hypothetical protein
VWWDRKEAQLHRKEEKHEGKIRGELEDVESVQLGKEWRTVLDFRKIQVPPQGQAKQLDRNRVLRRERSKVCGVAEGDGILLPQGFSVISQVEEKEVQCGSDPAFHLKESPLGWLGKGR